MEQSTKNFIEKKVLNVGSVGGVGPFEVYTTINWVLHCKVENNQLNTSL